MPVTIQNCTISRFKYVYLDPNFAEWTTFFRFIRLPQASLENLSLCSQSKYYCYYRADAVLSIYELVCIDYRQLQILESHALFTLRVNTEHTCM